MENLYANIAARTGGNIYIGVVGPVRTGKSTLIKRCILLTVCLIPLSLRLFSLNLVKRIKELPLQEALKSYRLWSEVRLALLMAPAILGISFYYLTLNTSGLFCACMALIASLFCVPSRKRLLAELDLPEDIND